jgi:ubiquinone/menaquinone biosynthesis C-methylase UbiE
VLDVGCGNGRLAQCFQNKDIEYLGVDSSEKLISLAKENYPDNRFLVDNMLELNSVPDNYFTHIFSIAVIHHLPGEETRREALENMKKKLTSNGKMIISVWGVGQQRKYLKYILISYFKYLFSFAGKLDFGDMIFNWQNSKKEKLGLRYYHAFTRRGIKKLCESVNLKIEEIISDGYNYYLVLSKK